MKTTFIVGIAFVSGVALIVAISKYLLNLRDDETVRGKSAVSNLARLAVGCVVFLTWLVMLDVILGALATSADERDFLGRVFLFALTVGIGSGVIYNRMNFRNQSGKQSGRDPE